MRKLLSLLLVAVATLASLFVGSTTSPASAAVPASSGMVWYNSQTGETQLWYMNSHRLTRTATVLYENGTKAYIGPPFKIVGTGDMNGDKSSDILWYNTQTGESQVWLMDGNRLINRSTVVYENNGIAYIGPPWKIVGNGDMNGDTKADILWYNTQTGASQVWYMNGNRRTSPGATVVYENNGIAYIGPPWKIVGNGDMNGDTRADILWYNTSTGESQVWYMNGNRRTSPGATVVYENNGIARIGPPFQIVANSDMNSDNTADIVWYNTQTGESQLWYMNGNRRITQGATVVYDTSGSGAYIGPPFSIVGAGKFNSPSSPTGIDDYPWSTPKCNPSGSCTSDPWGMTKQQCVSFVAWRLSQRGVSINGAYGDAMNWKAEAERQRIVVDGTPTVGSVAQWNSGEKSTWTDASGRHEIKAGPKGHVAYVTKVNPNRTVDVEEYNQNEDQSYHQQFSIQAPRYIHF